MRSYILAAILLALPATAAANQQAAASCAARLNPSAQMVYYATAPAARTAPSLRGLIKAKTTSLVRSGRLRRNDARPAAIAAFRCLKRLRS